MRFYDFEKFCQKNGLEIFTIKDLEVLFDGYSKDYLRLKISRWVREGGVSRIKNGLYTIGEVKDEFEIASHLITPSYVSGESALSHYSIIPDISAKVTSVTTKNTRIFTINGIKYEFNHIKASLFFGHNGTIATPEKAILDYFYFKNPKPEDQFFERLNPEILKNLDVKTMERFSKKFPKYVQIQLKFLKNACIKQLA